MTAPALAIDGLVAGYGGSRVLDGLDLAVTAGEVVGLMGRNGMGKSTLMRAVMGVVPRTAGRVAVAGRDTAGLAPFTIARLGVAFVPQGRDLFADFTVMENLELGVLGHERPRPGFADAVLALFPILKERISQKAGTFSGGQQQQLAIARALVSRPRREGEEKRLEPLLNALLAPEARRSFVGAVPYAPGPRLPEPEVGAKFVQRAELEPKPPLPAVARLLALFDA